MVNLTLAQITHIYNAAYNTGHDNTVEGCATPAHWASEMEEHHREEVCDLLEDMEINLDDISTEAND